jgi:hypothetical protein
VQRRLHVVEEVHVTLRRREERHREIVRTQQTQVVVERDGTVWGMRINNDHPAASFFRVYCRTRGVDNNK